MRAILLIALLLPAVIFAADCPPPVSDCLKVTWKTNSLKPLEFKSKVTGHLHFDSDGVFNEITGEGIDQFTSTYIFPGEYKFGWSYETLGFYPQPGWYAVVFDVATRKFSCSVPIKFD